MPHSTSRFPLERRILNWANGLSEKMSGASTRFFAVIDETGQIKSMAFGAEAKPDKAAASWLFFEPLGVPGYFYLEWHGVKQAVMERLMGEAFSKDDFLPRSPASGKGALKTFPESWSVMF